MNILVTGGAGFIGRHLVDSLVRRGHQVRVLDALSPQIHGPNAVFPLELIENADCLLGDVTVRADVERALTGVECVVHLAAETGMGQSQYEIARYFEVNVGGTAVLLDVLANSNRTIQRVVVPSSGRVYGEGPCHCPQHGRVFPATRPQQQLAQRQWEPKCPMCSAPATSLACHENDTLTPSSMYAVTKVTQERMLHLFGKLYGVETAALRYQNVYGSGQALRNPYTGVMSVFCTRIQNGLPPEIYEDGQSTRDFVHVSDVVSATVTAVEKKGLSDCTLNIGSGVGSTILDAAQMILQTFDSPLKPVINGKYRTGDIRHMHADISQAERVLEYRPQTSLSEGIREFIGWVRQQQAAADLSNLALQELDNRGLI